MATHAALSRTTYVDGYDMTADSNQTTLSIVKDPLDSTTFSIGRTSRSRKAGLEDVQSSVNGYADYASSAVDPQVFANFATRHVVTQTPAGVEAERAYFYQCLDLDYQQFGQVGELAPFSLSMQGTRGAGTLSAGAIAGYLGKAKGTVSATGALGTFKQLGAVSATQFLYGIFHVFVAATTITVVLESDDNSGFSSATTRATIGPLTAVGGTWITRVAGPITDDFYRLRVTAITGTFTVAGAFGIK